MGKKKFLRESDGDGSTDEESVTVTGLANTHSCPHVGKAVNISDLKKSLKVAWVQIGRCGQCTKSSKVKAVIPSETKKKVSKKSVASNPNTTPLIQSQPQLIKDPNTPLDIWLCLRCGSQNCCPKSSPTPTCQSHALIHFETPRSDLHCVVLNVHSWTLWCHECKSELYLDSFKKLHEAVDHVKRVATNKPAIKNTKKENIVSSLGTMKNSTSSSSIVTLNGTMSPNSVLPRARGLNNLGNTCFFNSVMQCLSAAHPFVRCLDIHCQKGALLNSPELIIPMPSKIVKRGDSGVGTSSNGSTLSDFDDCACQRKPLPTKVEALSLQLAEAGPTTLSLAAFFKDMHSIGPKTGSVNPGHLFGQICKRSPQFRGFQQQDAHELLRHLMDGLRCEEVRRQRLAILKHFGLNDKTDPKTVEEKVRQKINALSRHSNYTIVDKLFGGHLVSTIVCEQCHNSSQIYEPFLDLSLPLVDHKPQRPVASGSKKVEDDEVDVSCFGKSKTKPDPEAAKSKHQLKKERKISKLEKRRGKTKLKNTAQCSDNQPENDLISVDKNPEENAPELEKEINKLEKVTVKSEEIHTKHNTNNPKTKKTLTKPKRTNRQSFRSDDEEEDDEDGYSEEAEDDWDWDYGEQWKEGDEKKDPEKANEEEEEISSSSVQNSCEDPILSIVEIPKQSLNPLPLGSFDLRNSSERERSSEPTIADDSSESETGASFNGDVEDNLEENFNSYKPDSKHLDPHMEQLCRRIRKLSVTSSTIYQENEQREFAMLRQESENISEDIDVDTDDENQLVKLRQEWISRSLTSIASRYQSKKGECSIYSSLLQFTAPELLTGSNRWACDRCSEHQQSPSFNEEEKNVKKPSTVYSNASKQLLLFSPPAVLTIHLKRFQQTVSGLRKDNRHVQFPIDLNIAPFCSSTAISASNVEAGSEEILYDLFGVVEHSGRLQGGHYTAFVKVRPTKTTDFSKFFSEPTTKTDDVRQLVLEIERKCREKSQKDLEGSKSLFDISSESVSSTSTAAGFKWYHISDTSVSEATEERVLKSQAYILFYERIK